MTSIKKKKTEEVLIEEILGKTFVVTRMTAIKKIYNRGSTHQEKCSNGNRSRQRKSTREMGL